MAKFETFFSQLSFFPLIAVVVVVVGLIFCLSAVTVSGHYSVVEVEYFLLN